MQFLLCLIAYQTTLLTISATLSLLYVENTLAKSESRIKTIANVTDHISTAIGVNDQIIFESVDGYLFSYSTTTEALETIGKINSTSYTRSGVFNNSVYIGSSDGKLFEYNTIDKNLKEVADVKYEVRGGIAVLEDKIYYGNLFGIVYEYNPVTGRNREVTNVGVGIEQISAMEETGKLFFGNDDGDVYELDPLTGKADRIIDRTRYQIPFAVITMNKKVYFGSGASDIYEYNPLTKELRVVCETTNLYGIASMLVFNNVIYMGPQVKGTVWRYDPAVDQCEAVGFIKTKQEVNALAQLNNRLYIGDNDGFLFEYSEVTDINEAVVVHNLGEITNDDNATILIELSIQNPYLDVKVLEVGFKTDNYAFIRGYYNNNKYYGETQIFFSISDNKLQDLGQLIRKGIRVTYSKNNNGINAKGVSDISTSYSQHSLITASVSDNKPTITSSKSIPYWSLTFQNSQNKPVDIQTPAWNYSLEERIENKFETALNVSDLIGGNGQSWNTLLGSWPFEDVDVVCDGFRQKINDPREYLILGEIWDFSIENKLCRHTRNINVPVTTITVPQKSKLNVTATLNVNSEVISIDLEQVFGGSIVASVTNIFNEEVRFEASVKELMVNLDELGLLPSEITIDYVGSVTFKGRLNRTLNRESMSITNNWQY